MDKHSKGKQGRWLDLLIFVLFANVFFFRAFGTVALWLILTGFWVLVIRIFDTHRKETQQVKWWGSASLLSLMALYLTVNSGEKVVLLILTSLVVMLISVYSWQKRGLVAGILELGLSGLHVVASYIHSGWGIFQGITHGTLRKILPFGHMPKERSPWVHSVFVGILVGLPVVSWLVVTLTQADPVFASYIRHILSEKLLSELPGRLVLSTLLFIVLTPLLIMQWKAYRSPLAWLTKVKWGREMTVVTAMVAVVLAIFLVVQWPYVFASVARETDLSKYGVATYSEYVQKGFWDLLKVVLMVFGVSWIGFLLNKNQSGKERQMLMVMQGILGIEFLVFVISIFRRVWLYQSYHGFSLARLYGLALLVLIVGMSVTMGLRYIYRNVKWVWVEAGWVLFMIVATIGINMEGLVVAYPPTVNNRVDYVYLSRLSSDGKAGWLKAYDWANAILTKSTEKTEILSRDERRDIFYAGLITRELTNNYHRLIMQYGSDEEVMSYFRGVIETTQEVVNMSPIDGSASSVLGGLRQRQADLEKNEWLEKIDVTPRYSELAMYKDSNNRKNSYFYIQGNKEVERLSGLDSRLAWDPARNSVYTWMKQEIGYGKLLEMQKEDLLLQQRIASQPENERDFDVDISLDSPFLR